MVDLSLLSTTSSSTGCLMVTYSQISGSRNRPREDHTDHCHRVYPPCVLLPPNYTPDFDALGGLWRPDGVWRLKCHATVPPGSPEQGMTWQLPEGRPSMGRSTVDQPRSPNSSPLHGSALIARYHPSERTSPTRCDVVHPYHPWVRPSPHNRLPLYSCTALAAETAFFHHELPQGWLEGIYSRVREVTC